MAPDTPFRNRLNALEEDAVRQVVPIVVAMKRRAGQLSEAAANPHHRRIPG